MRLKKRKPWKSVTQSPVQPQTLYNCFVSDRQSSTWGVRLGQLLLSAKKQDGKMFYEKLKLVRKEQVVPLSAASYECGTYQRGYEYIIRSEGF